MADYYTNYSAAIPYGTDEQRDWLVEALAWLAAWEPDEEEREGAEPPDGIDPKVFNEDLLDSGIPAHEVNQEKRHVWVYNEDSGGLDVLIELVSAYQRRFDLSEPWSLQWGDSCSKPRINAFGGGAAVVYRGEVHSQHTSEWVKQTIDRLTGKAV